MNDRGVRWFVRMVLDRKSQDKVERQAKGSAKEVGGTWQKTMKRVALQIGTALAAAFAVGKIIAFTKEVVRLGVAGAETANKFRTTFGEANEEVDAFIANWGKMAGVSRDTGREMLATTGAILQGLGFLQEESAATALEVARLAGDMTSFHDVPVESTIQAINSALTGERERLKQLGIVLRETDVQQRALLNTGKASVQALTDQEKAAASLELIYERMGVAVGDLERTQLSQANLLRRVGGQWQGLKESIGEALMEGEAFQPVLLDLSTALEDAVGWVRENRDALAAMAEMAAQATMSVARLASDWVRLLQPLKVETGEAVEASLAWIRAGEGEEGQLRRLHGAITTQIEHRGRLIERQREQQEVVDGLRDRMSRMSRDTFQAFLPKLDQEERKLREVNDELAVSNSLMDAYTAEAQTFGQATETDIVDPLAAAVVELDEFVKLLDGIDPAKVELAGIIDVEAPEIGQVEIEDQRDPIEVASRWSVGVQEAMREMERASDMAAAYIGDAMTEAFSQAAEEGAEMGEATVAAFGAMAAGSVAFLDILAKQKAQENLARAIEMAAIGVGRLAFGDAAGASASFSSAGQHVAAAAAWGLMAGAIPGGGVGGSVGAGRPGTFDEPGQHYADRAEDRTPTTIIYLDPLHANNPAVQDVVYGAQQQALERFGSGSHVRPTREAPRSVRR